MFDEASLFINNTGLWIVPWDDNTSSGLSGEVRSRLAVIGTALILDWPSHVNVFVMGDSSLLSSHWVWNRTDVNFEAAGTFGVKSKSSFVSLSLEGIVEEDFRAMIDDGVWVAVDHSDFLLIKLLIINFSK